MTLAIADNNQLYGWGFLNVPPYTGVGPVFPSLIEAANETGWTAVAAGNDAWLAVAASGKIYGWRNGFGGMIQYPAPPVGSKWTKVAINYDDIMTLADSGRLYHLRIWDSYWPLAEVPLPNGATAWTDIASGQYFSLAMANDGNLYAWGDNEVGQLGIGVFQSQPPYGTNVPQRVPLPPGADGWQTVRCGRIHVLAVTADGQLYAWGANTYGQLGIGNTANQSSPTKVPNMTNVTAVAAGAEHSLAIADCQVFGWGENHVGQIGTSSITPFETLPVMAAINWDPCATNAPGLPVVSIIAIDDLASETTWRSITNHPYTNMAAFQVSRLQATNSPLVVHYSVGGTASNGVDYLLLPESATIPAGSNSVSVMITPIQDALSESPETINITLSPDAAYSLGNSTNVVITLIDYEDRPAPPPLPVSIPLPSGQTGQVFSILASTNLTQWSDVATVTNTVGIVSFIETNSALYRTRFFRAVALPAP